jgi:hypothetical protein
MNKVLSSVSTALFPIAQAEAGKVGAVVESFAASSQDLGGGRKKLVFTLEIQGDSDSSSGIPVPERRPISQHAAQGQGQGQGDGDAHAPRGGRLGDGGALPM